MCIGGRKVMDGIHDDGAALREAVERRRQCRDISCFDVRETLGEGTFGVVSLATDNNTGMKLAIKKLQPQRCDNEKYGFDPKFIREIKAIQAIGEHRNILELREVVTSSPESDSDSGGHVHLVFKYMPYDLAGVARRVGQNLNMCFIRCFVYQLLEGLHFIHRKGYMHRDLKSANLLINEDHELKIGDFDLARRTKGCSKLTSVVCTLFYRAPEQLLEFGYYDGKADLWAVGVITAELLNGGELIWNRRNSNTFMQWEDICRLCGTPTNETWPGIERKEEFRMMSVPRYRRRLKHRFAHVDPKATDFLDKVLVANPDKRISVGDALEHSFLWADGEPKPHRLPRFDFARCHDLESRSQRKRPRESEMASSTRARNQ
eukprot:gb/GECG01007027.1/.p1 GENE.gb/GECG01007027.1/~~gb/GECG01007027.1/.p1  ORF type:complete len:376 (+),score=32.55 gb/GECG01007027.1/:1-1128(+)